VDCFVMGISIGLVVGALSMNYYNRHLSEECLVLLQESKVNQESSKGLNTASLDLVRLAKSIDGMPSKEKLDIVEKALERAIE